MALARLPQSLLPSSRRHRRCRCGVVDIVLLGFLNLLLPKVPLPLSRRSRMRARVGEPSQKKGVKRHRFPALPGRQAQREQASPNPPPLDAASSPSRSAGILEACFA
jgi:hypothetical protein